MVPPSVNLSVKVMLHVKRRENKKIEEKIDGWNHHRRDKKERSKKGQKTNSPQESKP